MHQILIIDDDERLATPLAEYFKRYDLTLISATHPEHGLRLLQQKQQSIHLVILDVMLPDMDGFEVCREIRKSSDIPIIMLTARGEVMDRVIGLELGADDYLPKPFEPRELVARIQNILKRSEKSGRQNSAQEKIRNFGELEINLARQQVALSGSPVNLTASEFQLLKLLSSAPGEIFSRDQILNHLNGHQLEIFSRAVDIQISRLRQKLNNPELIKTVRGSGYAFIDPEA